VSTIDLTFAKGIVESLMTDTCRITRDHRGTHDSTLNTANGRLVTPAGQPTTVYEGPCKFRPEYIPGAHDEGGAMMIVYRYEVAIPLPDNVNGEPQTGDLVECVTSLRDTRLPGLLFVVDKGIEYKTFAIQRKMHCTLREPVEGRP
jgi:hypothetical protein